MGEDEPCGPDIELEYQSFPQTTRTAIRLFQVTFSQIGNYLFQWRYLRLEQIL